MHHRLQPIMDEINPPATESHTVFADVKDFLGPIVNECGSHLDEATLIKTVKDSVNGGLPAVVAAVQSAYVTKPGSPREAQAATVMYCQLVQAQAARPWAKNAKPEAFRVLGDPMAKPTGADAPKAIDGREATGTPAAHIMGTTPVPTVPPAKPAGS